MTQPDQDLETDLPDLASLPLSGLEEVRHPVLAAALSLLIERIDNDQDPLNSFNASI